MRGKLRRNDAIALACAGGGVWAMAYLALYGFGWNDYATEAQPAFAALTGGHLWRFLQLAPGYGGSLELRAPFALLPGLWGGGADSVYRAVSIPCLLAAAVFGVLLLRRMRALGHGRLAGATALAICVTNPVTLYALQLGHPEELLGAALCAGALIAARDDRATLSGILLGLAVANKQWALLAVGPVLLALGARRVRALLIAGAIAGVLYAPLLLAAYAGRGAGAASLTGATGATIFQPWQLWWFLGSHGHLVRGSFGDLKVGYRVAPAWLANIPHLLILALAVPASLLAWRRRGDPLLLFALLMGLRCALDSWDTVYYPLPFVFALLVWETLVAARPPLVALAASVVVWLLYVVAPEQLSADGQALLFALVAVPAIAGLALAVYAPSAGARLQLRRGSSRPAAAPISTA